MSNLLSTLSDALAGPLATLAGQFGVTIRIYRRLDVRQSDGTTVRTWSLDPTALDLPAFVTPLNALARDRTFGPKSVASFRLVLPRTADGLLAGFEVADGILVAGGPYNGRKLVAESPGVIDAGGLTESVPMIDAPDGAF